MNEAPILPAFYHTGFKSPITEYALMLLAQKDDNHSSIGTAIVVGNHLAITATQVVQGFLQEYGDLERIKSDAREGTFGLQAIQFINNGAQGKLWNIRQIVMSHQTDIAFLGLWPHTKDQLDYVWRTPELQLLPPAVGSTVTAFGYHSTKVNFDPEKGTSIFTSPYSSRGIVQEIHHVARDSGMLNFPCYRVNCRFAPAMSGGPVFSDDGLLCGLVCQGMNTASPKTDAEHSSYATILWPMMGVELNFDREGHPQGDTYLALELARDGIIHAVDWKRCFNSENQFGCSVPRELAENVKLGR